MAKKDLIEQAKKLGLEIPKKVTVKELEELIATVAPKPANPLPETEAEQTKDRPEMPIEEALHKFKVIRKYVSMDGKFRTGLTKEEMAEGKKMVKQLNIKM